MRSDKRLKDLAFSAYILLYFIISFYHIISYHFNHILILEALQFFYANVWRRVRFMFEEGEPTPLILFVTLDKSMSKNQHYFASGL